jgi:hypothetical protein
MAQSTFHFAVGMAVGSAWAIPELRRRWASGQTVARACGRWIVLSLAVGTYATLPSLLRYARVPESIVGAWWMNLFLLHPLIDRLKSGGVFIGEAAVAACFGAQYALMLLAIRRASARLNRARPERARRA